MDANTHGTQMRTKENINRAVRHNCQAHTKQCTRSFISRPIQKKPKTKDTIPVISVMQ